MSFNVERYDTLSEKMIEEMSKETRKIYKIIWKENVFWSDFGKGDNSKNNNDDNSKNNNIVKLKKTIHQGNPSNNSFSFCSEYKYNGKDEDEDLKLKQLSSELNEKKLTEKEIKAIKKEIKNIHKLKCKTLINAFNLNQGDFIKKFKQAVSGNGQELNKITTLHSSSLCCLLFFYNVSNNNPLTLKFETNNGGRRVTFTESVFEFKNEVISSPSNIDVVLIGEDEDKKNTILLFLESKFAEYYLSSGKTCDLGEGYLKNKIGAKLYKIKDDLNDEDDLNNDLGSMDYGKSYDLDGLKSLGVTIKKNKQKKNGKDKDVYKIHSNNISYIDGIKQMISHYIGIQNCMNEYHSFKEKLPERIKRKINNKDDIIFILGGIAFDFPNGDAKDALDDYRKDYKLLAEIIVKQESENSQFQFEILKDLLLYSQITEDEITKGEKNNYKVDEKVKLFYGMN